jgi:hypothetical protein
MSESPKILSRLTDKKINALNVLVEIRLKTYLTIANHIIDKNEMQRKKVRSSKSVYSLLRNDLKQGCTIPPICLAVRKEVIESGHSIVDLEDITDNQIIKYILDKNLIILDGLQRTYQLIELEQELKKIGDKEELANFYNRSLRAEIYIGVNKIGILYRMLTLNTGQTPMSIRHQIDILYQDYLGKNHIKDVELIKEIDGSKRVKLGYYKFNEIVDGFQSYLEKDELSIDRSSLLEDVKSLEKLSKVGQKKDLFKEFILCYHAFINQIVSLSDDWTTDDNEEFGEINLLFGNNVESIFIKSQVLTGFGAAIGSLEDSEITTIQKIIKSLDKMNLGGDVDETFSDLIHTMERIRTTSKKIGNSQRRYFYYFFKALFNPEADAYLNIKKTIAKAFQNYRVEFL